MGRGRAAGGDAAPAAAPGPHLGTLAAARGGAGVAGLLTYIFAYEDVTSLVCSAVIIWYFAGSFEKSVGTAKHCFLTMAFAVSSTLLYLMLWAVMSGLTGVADAEGFMPVAFAMLGASIARSQLKRTLLFGFNFRVALVPWLLLGVAWLIPHASLLGNFCGLVIGNIYGSGYCFGLDLPESIVSRLDQKFPFRLLKRIPGLKYVPGSLAERRACLDRKLNPASGSYPTQRYSTSPPPIPVTQMQHPSAHSAGSWPQPHMPAPNHPAGARGELCIQNHFHTPLGGSSCSPQPLGGPHSGMPKRTDGVGASTPPMPAFPATGAGLGSAELSQVHVD
ncbi:rhomboid domain-containing protein 2 isoform X2 [Hemicordylus capensis]|uniref:rhomboid domain-containing protein 2 isoform X2 n=1 Tax=Hemicordylus capensis TaxID=884348 RepID=UPI00230377C1|nr:rhomboid domain-containing protein 2 isoform X2 [Hemicordylus capensis]